MPAQPSMMLLSWLAGANLLVQPARYDMSCRAILPMHGGYARFDNSTAMQIRMLADPHLELAKALGVTLDAEEFLGTKRSKR